MNLLDEPDRYIFVKNLIRRTATFTRDTQIADTPIESHKENGNLDAYYPTVLVPEKNLIRRTATDYQR